MYLDLSLDVFDGITGLHLECDGLAGQGLDEDLHTSSQSEDQGSCGRRVDVVSGQRPAAHQQQTGEDQPLLVWGNSLLVLKNSDIEFKIEASANFERSDLLFLSFYDADLK